MCYLCILERSRPAYKTRGKSRAGIEPQWPRLTSVFHLQLQNRPVRGTRGQWEIERGQSCSMRG